MKALFFSLFLMIFSDILFAQQVDFFKTQHKDKSIELLNKLPKDLDIQIPFSIKNDEVISMPNNYSLKVYELASNFQRNPLQFNYNAKSWLEDEKTQSLFQGILKGIYYNNIQNNH